MKRPCGLAGVPGVHVRAPTSCHSEGNQHTHEEGGWIRLGERSGLLHEEPDRSRERRVVEHGHAPRAGSRVGRAGRGHDASLGASARRVPTREPRPEVEPGTVPWPG